MKVDFYTKAILTVIAGCLLIMVIRDLSIVPKAHATEGSIPNSAPLGYGLVPLNDDGSMNVRVSNFDEYTNDVNVRFNDELKVRITNSEIKTSMSNSFGNVIRVKLEK
ncbi:MULTISPECIES: hypothetical protein [Myroides]|uniref:Uncharacterized protein n=1 Tax=Myroides albus TaxID=2562892 RepID=A0A6I3LSM8_9FLAO|nr:MULTISPECIES: hypothetical protein [Myroides]MTG98995.1 hypothetical protein [Myroides albus]MVX35771.1 hypothetical protein [Myroides sp. LoEW2-1]UVD78253.1 hypothetical protein NWE55_08880 [Myroides albus]